MINKFPDFEYEIDTLDEENLEILKKVDQNGDEERLQELLGAGADVEEVLAVYAVDEDKFRALSEPKVLKLYYAPAETSFSLLSKVYDDDEEHEKFDILVEDSEEKLRQVYEWDFEKMEQSYDGHLSSSDSQDESDPINKKTPYEKMGVSEEETSREGSNSEESKASDKSLGYSID